METCQSEFVPPSSKREVLPAVYIIFTLLNAFRRGIPWGRIWRDFRRQKIALRPQLSFWLALEPDAQAFRLLEAWQNAPKNYAERRFRRKLVWKLKWDKQLTKKDLRFINGCSFGAVAGRSTDRLGTTGDQGRRSIPHI